MHHICWGTDGIIVNMSKQKSDQSGDHITPKNIYANPFNPYICPLLAPALHVLSGRFLDNNNGKYK